MKFSEAFRETLFRFGLKSIDIAEQSGLTTGEISQFRNGKNLRMDSVERILEVLSPDARLYMLKLVARNEPSNPESTDMSNEGNKEVL